MPIIQEKKVRENIDVSKLISPCFYEDLMDLLMYKYSYLWEYGGRGSFKSSFIGIAIPILMMQDPEANCICLRNIGGTCRNSVYNQIVWGINQLGVSHLFKLSKGDRGSPPITYLPYGTKIYFSGLDDPEKIKSFKPHKGYLKISWFEEFPQFRDMETIRNALQSIRRGSDKPFITIFSGNPVRFKNHWSNIQFDLEKDNPKSKCHLSTYLDTPEDIRTHWLGQDWIDDAERLRDTNYEAYKHEYLGIPTGYGTGVFNNVYDMDMSEEMISKFDNVGGGVDWGFAEDPTTYTLSHFDSKKRDLYIFEEIFATGMFNLEFYQKITSGRYKNELIVADSEDPKSIADMQQMGLRITGARKGSGSIEYGIKQLQELNHIYIDKKKCPNAYREFMNAEYDVDKFNNILPHLIKDKNNHIIDNIRYRMENEWQGAKWGWGARNLKDDTKPKDPLKEKLS